MVCGTREIAQIIEKILKANDGTYESWVSAAYRNIRFYFIGKPRDKIEPKDIVHSVIEKLCSGRRKWDMDKYPSFNIYFFLLIKSHIRNLASVEEKFVDPSFRIGDDEEEGSLFDCDCVNRFRHLLSERDLEELKKLCMARLKDDEDATILFLCLCDYLKNEEAAETLGVSIEFVNNTKKRIKRALLPLFEEYFDMKINAHRK